jgi:N utilization substance protein B
LRVQKLAFLSPIPKFFRKISVLHVAAHPFQAIFIRSLVKGTLEHLFEIDDYIERYAIEWDLSRMANVDRNILRMGLYEMLYCQGTPLNVAINEALELAKTFSHEEAPRFINGILGKIAEEMNRDPGNTI